MSGFYFAHPESKYFSVGKIGDDQVVDMAKRRGVPKEDVHIRLEVLREICEARDLGRLVVALKELVPDYSPSVHLLKRIMARDEQTRAVTRTN